MSERASKSTSIAVLRAELGSDDEARARALDEIQRAKGRQPSNWRDVLGPETGEFTRVEVTTGAKVFRKAVGR